MYFISLLVYVLDGIIHLKIVKTSLYFIQSIINNKRNLLVIYDNKEKNMVDTLVDIVILL